MLMMNMRMTADDKCEDGNADTGMSVGKYMAEMLTQKMMTQVKMGFFLVMLLMNMGTLMLMMTVKMIMLMLRREDDNADAEEAGW